jgi:hypothetical protein
LAALTKEREQAKDRSSVITTQIQSLGVFYPAEPEHQVAMPLELPSVFASFVYSFRLRELFFMLEI